MINKKRGVSQVIATVLILLLTISAVAVLAAYVIPYVKNNLYDSTSCVKYRDYFKFEEYDSSQQIKIGYTCYDQIKRLTGISVRAKHDNSSVEEVQGFYLAFITEGNSKAVKIDREATPENILGGIWMLNGNSQFNSAPIEVPQNGEVITYIYNDPTIYEVIEISPILKSGKSCPVSDNINIITCELPDSGAGPSS